MPTLLKTKRRPWQPRRQPQEGRIHSNTKFYQSTAWRKLRALQLKRQPLCEDCGVAPARVADHIIPINRGGESLSIDNLQSLCHSCHNRKSGRESHTR